MSDRAMNANTAMLDFATGLSARSGGSSGELPQRTPEEMQWLRNALAQVETPVDVLKKALENVEKADDDVESLETIAEMVEDIDLGMNFIQMNGHKRVVQLLDSPTTDVRRWSANIFAAAPQNHPAVQNALLEFGLLPVLLQKIDSEENDGVRHFLCYACSSMCRGHPGCSAAFAAGGGMDVLERVFTRHRSDIRTLTRCVHFVRYLLVENSVSTQAVIRCVCDLIGHDNAQLSDGACLFIAAALPKDPSAIKMMCGEQLKEARKAIEAKATPSDEETALVDALAQFS